MVDNLVVQDVAKVDINGSLALFPAESVGRIEERAENLAENVLVVEPRIKSVEPAVVAHDSHGPQRQDLVQPDEIDALIPVHAVFD